MKCGGRHASASTCFAARIRAGRSMGKTSSRFTVHGAAPSCPTDPSSRNSIVNGGGMDFGLFYLMQRDEAWSEDAVYSSDLQQMLAAEGLGYHSVWIAEHHFNDYRSEEHTSELQSHSDLVCRLLLVKKNS